MKLFKTVPAAVLLAGGMLASHIASASDSVFTVMDDPSTAKKPFEGDVNAGYLAQSGNSRSSSLTADSTMTWYGQSTAWSLWGTANNTSSNDVRSSEKYAAGGRARAAGNVVGDAVAGLRRPENARSVGRSHAHSPGRLRGAGAAP